MNILAIDTAGTYAGIALLQGDTIVAGGTDCARSHADVCLDLLHDLLAKAALTLNAIDCYAFSEGPGGYTGLRVGAGIIQGLSLVHPQPVIHIPTPAAYAYAFFKNRMDLDVLRLVMHAYGDQYYTSIHKRDTPGINAPLEDNPCQSEVPHDAIFNVYVGKSCSLTDDFSHCYDEQGTVLASIVVQLANDAMKGRFDPMIQTQACPSYLKKASDWHRKV